MTKPNWIIHFVQEHDCDCCGKHEEDKGHVLTGFANIHTHGFSTNNHDEICVPFDIGTKVIMQILNTMGFRIRDLNDTFDVGKNSTILGGDFDVEFYRSNNSKVLYMLLPDPNNKFPGEEGCEFPYSQQKIYADIIEEESKEQKI